MALSDLAIVLFSFAASLQAGQEQRSLKPPVFAPAARSQREVPPKAAAEFRKSREAFELGQIDKAIRYLRSGIALDPANTDAYNDLGVIYYNLNQMDKAIESFAAMVEIDPHCFRGFVNMSFLFHALHRDADAERAARKAIDLQKSDIRARYLLGASLAAQNKNLDEALENLRTSSGEFPDAHLEISRILIQQGDFENAMQSLQTFTKLSGNLETPGRSQLLAK